MSVLTGNNNDGLLMYFIHRGFDQLANRVYSDANQVWNEESDHEAASLYGVAETNIAQITNAEILGQTEIKKIPTILFVLVENNQMTTILSRLEGGVDYSKIRKEFRRLLNTIPVDGDGSGSGRDEVIEGSGLGGLGLGSIGNTLGCPRWMPGFICNLPWILLLILIGILVFLALRKLAK